jgi:hypothetical protein
MKRKDAYFAEFVTDLSVPRGPWEDGRCNVHLDRCDRFHAPTVTCKNPVIAATDPPTHGKGFLADNCNGRPDATPEDPDYWNIGIARISCRKPSGDGGNFYACQYLRARDLRVSGPKRNDDQDIAAGWVLDEGSAFCVIGKLTCTRLPWRKKFEEMSVTRWLVQPAALVVLGHGHKISKVTGGMVQVGLDMKYECTDIELFDIAPKLVAVSPWAKRVYLTNRGKRTELPAGTNWSTT